MLAFHISNGYLNLTPIIGALARDAGLVCLTEDEPTESSAETDAGKYSSQWVVLARSRADLGALSTDAHWTTVNTPTGAQVWTDDYSNLLRVIKFH